MVSQNLPVIEKWLRVIVLGTGLTLVVSFAVLVVQLYSDLHSCPFEATQSLKLSPTGWVVKTLVSSCGALDTGRMKIVAENGSEAQGVTIATLYEPENVTLSLRDGNLHISLPNSAELENPLDQFGEIKVVYDFTPKDDPEERANYRLWRHHPEDRRAQEWFFGRMGAKTDSSAPR